MREEPGFRKWLCPGVPGALLMLTGDWLLGYVDPELLIGGNTILRAGYARDYALWRPAAAMVTGTLDVLCYLPGLWGMALTIRGKTHLPHWAETGMFLGPASAAGSAPVRRRI